MHFDWPTAFITAGLCLVMWIIGLVLWLRWAYKQERAAQPWLNEKD